MREEVERVKNCGRWGKYKTKHGGRGQARKPIQARGCRLRFFPPVGPPAHKRCFDILLGCVIKSGWKLDGGPEAGEV